MTRCLRWSHGSAWPCAGLASLRIDNNPVDDVKSHPGSVVGAQLLAEHYPAGTIAPLVLLAPPAQAAPAAAAARATPGVGSVVPGAPVEGYHSYSVVLPLESARRSARAVTAGK